MFYEQQDLHFMCNSSLLEGSRMLWCKLMYLLNIDWEHLPADKFQTSVFFAPKPLDAIWTHFWEGSQEWELTSSTEIIKYLGEWWCKFSNFFYKWIHIKTTFYEDHDDLPFYEVLQTHCIFFLVHRHGHQYELQL